MTSIVNTAITAVKEPVLTLVIPFLVGLAVVAVVRSVLKI